MRLTLGFLLAVVASTTASAQSTYVGAAFIGDIVRGSGDDAGTGASGETFGGALRVGTPLGARWGVELEIARSGEIDALPGAIPFAAGSLTFSSDAGVIGSPLPVIRSPLPFSSRQQLSTLSTMLWWNQELSQRVALVYLGGVSFTRTELDIRVEFPFIPFPMPIDMPFLPPQLFESETVDYDANIGVGFEGWIGVTDHLRFTPGVRLQTAGGGLAIRPAADFSGCSNSRLPQRLRLFSHDSTSLSGASRQ